MTILKWISEPESPGRCDCSRERVERAYISLGKRELAQIASEQETVELSCQFCNKTYTFRTADYIDL